MPLTGEYEPSTAAWVRNQVELYERTGGAEGNGLRGTSMRVVIMSSRGNRSGKVRKSAVMRVEHDGQYALVGSLGGAQDNPSWVYNLRAHPDEVAIQDGAEPFDVVVRELEGDERAAWWERAVAAFPNYAGYQENTERLIPVFVATRTGSDVA